MLCNQGMTLTAVLVAQSCCFRPTTALAMGQLSSFLVVGARLLELGCEPPKKLRDTREGVGKLTVADTGGLPQFV